MSLYVLMMTSSVISLILLFQSQYATTASRTTTMIEKEQQRFAFTTQINTTILKKNRNFMTHPITAEESHRLLRATRLKHRQKYIQQHQNESSSLNDSDSSSTMRSPDPPPFLRLAVCHPTIFIPPPTKLAMNNATRTKNKEKKNHDNNDSNMMLQRFLVFASYYRLLGFEHLFFWYEGPVAKLPYFDQLAALPYVTLTEYRQIRHNTKNQLRTGGDEYHGQGNVADLCLQDERFGRLYDWVLSVDADEYLWLAPQRSTTTTAAAAAAPLNFATSNTRTTTNATNHHGDHVRLTIHDFLEPYHAHNYNYISIGKFLYSTKHVDGEYVNNTTNNDKSIQRSKKKKKNPFGLQQYPYTPGPYCYKSKRRWAGYPYCPNWMGRSKILVRPDFHSSVQVHGTNHGLLNEETGIHLHALEQGHLKEWIWIHEPPQPSIVHFDNASFHVTNDDQLRTYFVMESSRRDEQDRVVAFHDGAELREWFDFLSQQLLLSTVPIKGNNYDDDDNIDSSYVHKPNNSGDNYRSIKKHNDTKATRTNNDIRNASKKPSRMNHPSNNNELQYSESPIKKRHILRLSRQLQEGRSAHKLEKFQSLFQPQEQ
jgi:hypothetical protein